MHYHLATDTLRYSNGALVPDEPAIAAELRRRGAMRAPTGTIRGEHAHLADEVRVVEDLLTAAVIAHPLPDTPAADPDLRIDLLAATLPHLRGLHCRALLYATVLNTYPPAWWFEAFAIRTAQSYPPALLQPPGLRAAARTPADLQTACAAVRAVELLARYGGDGEQLTRRADLFSGVGWFLEGRMGVVRGRVHTVTVRDAAANDTGRNAADRPAAASTSATSPARGAPATRRVELLWTCPVCGGPRGEPYDSTVDDEGAPAGVQCWENSCGHVDSDVAVVVEAERLSRAGLPELSGDSDVKSV